MEIDAMSPRGIWRTGIYKPAILVVVFGFIAVCLLLSFLTIKFFNSSSFLDKAVIAILTYALWEVVSRFSDRLTVQHMNEKIESDLKWAIRIGRKYPQCRALCKSLNPILTDEMLDKKRPIKDWV